MRRYWLSDFLTKRHRIEFPAYTKTDSEPSRAWSNLYDVAFIEMILRRAARLRNALSYAETLSQLGHGFSRPKMRALCATLNEVDNQARLRGEPALAVLVVRASDGLPGAGWWISKERRHYQGPWEGPQAHAYIKRKQKEAFKFWRENACD